MDYVDSYLNNSMDTAFAYKFALQLYPEEMKTGLNWFETPKRPEYLTVVDDDAYVNLPSLWTKLFITERVRVFLKGCVILDCNVFASQEQSPNFIHGFVQRKQPAGSLGKRLIAPSYIYDGAYYPDCANGGKIALNRS